MRYKVVIDYWVPYNDTECFEVVAASEAEAVAVATDLLYEESDEAEILRARATLL